MKKIVAFIALVSIGFALVAQDAPKTLKPNYRKIARVMKVADGPYFGDSLVAWMERGDRDLDVDQWRCLYYGTDRYSVADAQRRFKLISSRMGLHSPKLQAVKRELNGLQDAVWSTGNGTKKKPLYVRSREDAEAIAMGYTEVLWFRMRKGKKFSVAPQP